MRGRFIWAASAIGVFAFFVFIPLHFVFAQPLFEDVAPQLGLADSLPHGSAMYWYDYDGDGDLDLYFAHRYGGQTLIYRNDGDHFVRLDNIGFPVEWDGGITVPMDFDHDGDLDIYNRSYHTPSPLYVYENGGFVDQTELLDLPYETGTRGFQWIDINRDGWMDLLWGHYISGFHLYRNDGGTRFTDITAEANLPSLSDFSELCEADVDLDGDIDLFMTRVGGDDHFFVNVGNGQFEDRTEQAGFATACGNVDCRWVDFDHDKYPDLLTQSTNHHTIWHNNQDGTFTEMNVHGTEANFDDAYPYGATYAVADYDMDGDYDFYAVRPGGSGIDEAANQMFIQDSLVGMDIWFHDIAPELGMDFMANGSQFAADIDGDGDMDLCVSGYDIPLHVFRNNTISNNYLKVRVLGPEGEQDRWHTRVEVYPHGGQQVINSSEMNTSNSNLSGLSNYFVLDENGHYDLRIYFACGTVMLPENYPQLSDVVPAQVDHLLTVYMGHQILAGSGSHLSPVEFELAPAYPNPFNPTTTLGFSIPQESQVQLSIYNITGQHVTDLVNGNLAAGKHRVVWNAANNSSGIYFAKLHSGNLTAMQKIILLK